MARRTRVLALAVAWALFALAPAAAQAPVLAAGEVARVGEEPIAKSDFDHWLRAAARGNLGPRAVLDPPRFRRCIAVERRRARSRGRRPSRRTLRTYCRRVYEGTRPEVMGFLISSAWIRQEAAARGIVVTRRQVRRQFFEQKRQSFRDERDFRRFLRDSGQTVNDLLYRVRVDLLSNRVRRQVIRAVPRVTSAEIDEYYARHRRRFRGEPRSRARRTIRWLLTSEREQAALDAFIEDFNHRYRAITTCRQDYATRDCGATAAP